METVDFVGFPHELAQVYLMLLAEVTEPTLLRDKLVKASRMPNDEDGQCARAAVDFCFLDASKILSINHLVTAVQAALLNAAQKTLRTPTIHSEIIYFLTPSPNIAEGIRFFGVGPTTKHLLVIKAGQRHSDLVELQKSVENLVSGAPSPLSLIGRPSIVEQDAIYKHYRLEQDPIYVNKDEAALENVVCSICALKSAGT